MDGQRYGSRRGGIHAARALRSRHDDSRAAGARRAVRPPLGRPVQPPGPGRAAAARPGVGSREPRVAGAEGPSAHGTAARVSGSPKSSAAPAGGRPRKLLGGGRRRVRDRVPPLGRLDAFHHRHGGGRRAAHRGLAAPAAPDQRRPDSRHGCWRGGAGLRSRPRLRRGAGRRRAARSSVRQRVAGDSGRPKPASEPPSRGIQPAVRPRYGAAERGPGVRRRRRQCGRPQLGAAAPVADGRHRGLDARRHGGRGGFRRGERSGGRRRERDRHRARHRPFRRARASPPRHAERPGRRPGQEGRPAGAGRELGQHDHAPPALAGADPPGPLASRQPFGAVRLRTRASRPRAQRPHPRFTS